MAPRVIAIPSWVIAVRGVQILFAVIVLGISSYGAYWIHFHSWGFAIFTSLTTMIIVVYAVITSQVAACQAAYNYWAILVLDSVGVIFWLSSMAALAATRATFKYPTRINECVNDGSGGICDKRRDMTLGKRDGYVATYSYLNMMSGAAGISAIEMVLFILTLTIFALNVKTQRISTLPDITSANNKVESYPMNNQSYDPPNPQQYAQQYPQQYPQPFNPQQYPQQPQQYMPVPQQTEQHYQ